ncbi:MAG: hypothetical protein QY332_01020 [Anaerolineales bacterium]|nr:MAG: hypothetical protein QY332_01020 [Anaerolineales bacterium]
MVEPAAVESVRRRYLATIGTQFIQLAAGIATAGVVPRALGPANFGNFNYLMITAATIRGFLEPSAQQAFFTFSSQERRSGGLTRLYALVLFVQVLISFGFIGVVAVMGKLDWLWSGQVLNQIFLVTVLEWMIFITASLRQLGDSKGLTVHAQVFTLVTSMINVVGLLGLSAFGLLNLYSYIAINMFSASLIAVLLIRWLVVNNSELTWAGSLGVRAREYIRRWWRFAAPLILLEYYTPLIAYVSAYLLQRWYGSVEQGYFALALKWSAFILVFTSSALSIFWREIANAMANDERERAARTYLKFTHLLFFLALALCSWLSFGSRFLVHILVGDEYSLAVPVLAIMAFYPLQQTYGQINTAALKGSEKTKTIRNLGILVSIPDLILSYFLLASPHAPVPGLGLGAIGVALRMVVFGLLFVQVYEWMSHRTFGLSYLSTLTQKLAVAAVILFCGYLAMSLLGTLLEGQGVPILAVFGITSLIFFAMVGTCGLFWPSLLGISRAELADNLKKGRVFVSNLIQRGMHEK